MKQIQTTAMLALLIILCGLTIVSCGGNAGNKAGGGDTLQMEYARLLTIEHLGDYDLVTIADPWKERAVLHQYALIKTDAPTPTDLPPTSTILRVPMKSLCVSTSVHANLLLQLGAQKNMSSLCDVNYIQSSQLRQLISSHALADAGSSMNPNIERIVSLNTDGIMMSPLEGASYGLVDKTAIPIIECADYMETSALGRAEWMKFYGMLVGKAEEATALFEQTKTRYMELKTLAASASSHPKLLVDMLNAQTWYMPGGNSTYGALYRDAGADYSLADDSTSGSKALSLEKVMTTALDADIWLIKYGQTHDHTYTSLAHDNVAYTQFKAYKNRRIYGCNTLRVPFYDEVPFRPDLLMADVVKILHPTLLPSHQLHFYTPLD